MKRSLLLGAGNSRLKKMWLGEDREWVGELTTIDMDTQCGADIVMELPGKLPFQDETFDEIGAYDCLEHWGRQGDWKGWFTEISEYHRVLKPGGTFGIVVPVGQDALADPGHTRFFHRNHFGFLTKRFYEDNLAKGLPITDYRWYIKRWWEIVDLQEQGQHHLAVMLRRV